MPRGQTKFERCVRGVSRSGSAADPRAVCGAMRAKGTLPREQDNPAGEEIELGGGEHFLPLSTQAHAEQMARLLRSEGATASATQFRGKWGVLHKHSGKVKPGGRRRKGKQRNNRGRRNPLDGAEKRYESFHGRGSEEIVEVSTPIHEHSVLSGIGDLVKLIVITDDGHKVVISKLEDKDGNPALLAQNEAATQLYIEGGDQSVRLSDFGVYEPYHENETLGRVRNVYYFTRKDHLGSEGGTAIYNHKFGGVREVTVRGKARRKRSPLPYLVYDVRNKLLAFSGGGYTIPDEGIAN
jgi:hypothetical protein